MSTSTTRARIYHLFLEVLDVEPASRESFLSEQCRGDEVVRAEVEALLRVALHESTDTQALIAPIERHDADLRGHEFGRFRLEEQIGAGGMGVVYRGRRVDDVEQTVAVKLVSAEASLAGPTRFKQEVQHLARLEHPAIARLIDAGFDHGQAWLVMEFVRGERIDNYCAARALSERQIVGLLVQIADALAAAHRALVVHSDIKPANVLVTTDGAPKLIDFGISTALREAGASNATTGTERLFSPGFAAPELIQGEAITVATDVFGLGALAHRLLTGKPIFPEIHDPAGYMQAIAHRDIALPSDVARRDEPTPGRSGRLRGDLDAILCKALQREPARRYASVSDMQSDLNHYLAHRPVGARRQTLSYRTGKFVQRNAVPVGLVSLLLVSLAAGSVTAQQQWRRAHLARDMAQRRGEFVERLLQSADPRLGRRDVTVAELLDGAVAKLHGEFGSEPLVEASMLQLIAQTNAGLGRFPEAISANEQRLALLRGSDGDAATVGQALAMRGELLAAQGKWAEAEPPLRQAISLLRPVAHDNDLCSTLNTLGSVYAHSGREKEAEATYVDELATEAQCGVDPKQRQMYPYRSLAVLLSEQGRYHEAAEYARLALDRARQSLPASHPDRLNIKTIYAGALLNIKRAGEAEPLMREVIATQTQVEGADHKDTLLTKLVLADLLLKLHRDAEAAELSAAVARGLNSALGPDNTYTLAARLVHGIAQCNHAAAQDGLAEAQAVEAARRRLLPKNAWLIDAAAVGVGTCLIRMQRYGQAEEVLIQAVRGLEMSRGTAFRRTQEGYAALRDAYLAAGQEDEARRWSQKLLQ